MNIDFDTAVSLRKEGHLKLGVSEVDAQRLLLMPSFQNVLKRSRSADKFWNIVAVSILLGSLVLSVTIAWWWFLIGFVLAGALKNANKKSAAQNVLDVALENRELYDFGNTMGIWGYELDDKAKAKIQQKQWSS